MANAACRSFLATARSPARTSALASCSSAGLPYAHQEFIEYPLSRIKLLQADQSGYTNFLCRKLITGVGCSSCDVDWIFDIRQRLFIHLGLCQAVSEHRQEPDLGAGIPGLRRCR